MQIKSKARNDLPPLVIVAGGKGVRMGDLTQHIPKALVKIADQPFLLHQIEIFAAQGIQEFIIASGYQHNAMLAYLKQYPEFTFIETHNEEHIFSVASLHLRIIDTGENTGNAARVKQLIDKLPEQFFMSWCDNISDTDLNKMLDFHSTHKKNMTMLTVNPPERFGLVKLDNNLVKQLDEKLPDPNRWINAGLFIVNKDTLHSIKSKQAMWEYDVLPALINKQEVMAFKHIGYWQCMDNINDRMMLEADYLNDNWPFKDILQNAYSSNRL